MRQSDSNPYEFSDSNKRYMTYDWYMKRRFGGKIAKIPLDIGCTCPNIDGARGRGGCIYCKSGSRSAVGETIAEQYARGVQIACRKWRPTGFIPYLQSNTNTYGDAEYLRRKFAEAATLDGAKMLDIATRADCLGDEMTAMLADIAHEIPLTVELGLQSSDDGTAERINRCHTYAEFTDGYGRLRAAADKINAELPYPDSLMRRFTICIHIINGLPGEGEAEMKKTASDVAALHPDMVKIHLLHILRGTRMAEIYERGEYTPLTRESYVRTTCDQLEMLPPDTVIARVTGDGVADDLVAPEWSRRKTEVANEIDKELYRRRTYQGAKYCTNARSSASQVWQRET